MKLITVADPGLPGWLAAALAHAVSWRSAIFVVAVLVIGSVARLLAEWQRRKTLVAMIKHAPRGTVIEQERGRGGPAMRIEIGSDLSNQSTPGGGR